jgi:antirestriction protein ArdC
MKYNKESYKADWLAILKSAVNEPGKLMEAYRLFHNFSMGNTAAAMYQCSIRGIEIGPMKTFNQWKALGRTVKKGESGIYMQRPYTYKDKDSNGREIVRTTFTWQKLWFAYSQTEGEEYVAPPITEKWDAEKALNQLGIKEIPFNIVNGNAQGYATGEHEIAINPLAQLPHKTRFHEIAHIVHGHVDRDINPLLIDTDILDKADREVEAESTALLLLETLELDGAEFARGYIQNWMKRDEITESQASRIIQAAEKILKAGLPDKVAPKE